MRYPLTLAEDNPALRGHSLFWEMREICRTLCRLGFEVDMIDMGEHPPPRYPGYQGIVSIHDGLWRYAQSLPGHARKMMWMTGSHPEFQNRREMERLHALESRRNCVCIPRRQIPNPATEVASMAMADHCALVGNETTRATYPVSLHAKIELIQVSAEASRPKPTSRMAPSPREFVWLSSSGAILKGLDILLDLFSSHMWPTLHIIGPIEQEEDFANIYHAELEEHPRIKRHGFRLADDPELLRIFDLAAIVLHPSASEGMSGAVSHCLQAGLYPIISRASGIDLPAGCGRYLETCTHDEVAAAIQEVLSLDDARLVSEIEQTQAMAIARLSRNAFSQRLAAMFGTWLDGWRPT